MLVLVIFSIHIYFETSVRHISDQKFDIILFFSFALFSNFGLSNLVGGKLVLHVFYKPHTLKAELENLIYVFIFTVEKRLLLVLILIPVLVSRMLLF